MAEKSKVKTIGNAGTVLRTFRISRELDDILKQEAYENRTNLNAFVSGILEKYSVWDRLAEKFGMISLSKEVFKGILESTDENELIDTARELGLRTPKAGILFWFKELNVKTFLSGTANLFRYGKMGECEIKSDGMKHVVIIRHELGLKWSEFLKNYLDAAADSVLHIHPKFDVSPTVLSMAFVELAV